MLEVCASEQCTLRSQKKSHSPTTCIELYSEFSERRQNGKGFTHSYWCVTLSQSKFLSKEEEKKQPNKKTTKKTWMWRSQMPAACSAQVPSHLTWKCTGWTDTSKSLVIPHFRSVEINFIINLEAWFNCANFLLGADRFLLRIFPLYVMNHSEASFYLYLLKV